MQIDLELGGAAAKKYMEALKVVILTTFFVLIMDTARVIKREPIRL